MVFNAQMEERNKHLQCKYISEYVSYFLGNVEIVSIAPSGRSGSFFIQSILDSHENIVTIPFNASIFAIYDDIHHYINKDKTDIESIISYVCEKTCLKYYFFEKYDEDDYIRHNLRVIIKGKEMPLHVDVKKFRDSFKEILVCLISSGRMNRKGLFYGIYLAWALANDKYIKKIRYIVDQTHDCEHFPKIYQISPTAKFIHTIRDPRAR